VYRSCKSDHVSVPVALQMLECRMEFQRSGHVLKPKSSLCIHMQVRTMSTAARVSCTSSSSACLEFLLPLESFLLTSAIEYVSPAPQLSHRFLGPMDRQAQNVSMSTASPLAIILLTTRTVRAELNDCSKYALEIYKKAGRF
jgi:hypothetical protein